jgi:hypothetical protein
MEDLGLFVLSAVIPEEGWGCGYHKLKHADTHKQARISFEDWLEIRTVVMSQNALSKLRFDSKKS